MTLSTSRCLVALTGATAVLVLSSCGQVSAPGGPGPGADPGVTSEPTGSADVVDLGAEVVGQAMLLQSDPGAPVEACLGVVLESYPPQCSGPEVRGDFSWEEVGSETASGVTWSESTGWLVGHFDPTDGEAGSFTLTRPVSAEPPDGFSPPTGQDMQFPQLCDDPTVDVSDEDQAARTRGPEGMDEEQALLELLHGGGLDGYVTSWVSDGGPTFNVIVKEDADGARAAVREVFHGPLCVEVRDLPAQEEVREAQQALMDLRRQIGLQSAGGGGASGLLEVEVVAADRATVDAVHEAVAEWLTPDQVVIRSALRPLGTS